MSASKGIEQFLDLSRLGGSGKVYTIGPFFSNGVTLLKQQIRALNLVHSLAICDSRLLSPTKRVAVIGGGIAGVTAAAAAVYLGSEVDLFEQRPVLCHLQHGCDTRYVHPNIYDWPDPNSDNPYADLPLLSWKAGTAAEVTRQIVNKFEELVKDAEASHRFRRHLGATTQIADGGRVRWDNSGDKPRGGQERFDLIILAAGFGVELGVGEGAARSYWRNDDINQPIPGITSERRQLYLISGTGDGGLVDLLRCRIKGFNQGWLLDELVSSDDSILIEALKRITKDWKELGRNARRRQRSWLFDRFLSLAGPDLRLIDALNNGGDIPTKGRNLAFIANVRNALHFRIFDANGQAVVDTNESQLPDSTPQIAGLKSLLRALWIVSPLPLSDKAKVITAVISIVGHAPLAQTGILGGLRWRLQQRLRGDTTAILNGRATTFAEVLRLDSASLFNTLLTFLLYELDGFSYVHGICRQSATDNEAVIEQDPLKQMERPHRIEYVVERLIIRHGTDLRKPLQMLGVTNQDIDDLEQRQRSEDLYDNTKPLWSAGWWSDEQRKRLNPSQNVKTRFEFVPRATVALATTFVATLAAVLVEQLNRGSDGRPSAGTTNKPGRGRVPAQEFRATLHRLLEKRHEQLFQQIAFYEGYGRRLTGLPARVFNVHSGLVGLACRLGKPVLLNCGTSDGSRWRELWNALQVGEDIETPPHNVKSMLACPLFAATENAGDMAEGKHVSMVLFMDFQSPKFFDRPEVMGLIIAACAGFVKNLNELGERELEHEKGDKVVRFSSSKFQGYKVPPRRSPEDLAILRNYRGLVTEVPDKKCRSLLDANSRFRARSSLDISI
jgi:hypothetical protein